MFEWKNKEYRSLEEQVQKNMDDIEELFEGGGGSSTGWSTEAIDMFENLLHQIIYKDATTGQNFADALIGILRSTKVLVSITATDKYPEKKRYVGNIIDPSEFTVTANYSDGKSEELENYTIYPATYQEDGKVYFSYRGLDAVVTVPIYTDSVVDWAIVDYEPKQMRIGSTVSETLTSVKYKLIYASGAESIEDDMNNLSFSPDTVSGLQNTINVTVNGTELSEKPILIVGTATPTYLVTYSGDSGCTVSVSGGILSGDYVEEGTIITVTATPLEGYRIKLAYINGTQVTLPYSVTVNENINILVSSELAPATEITYTGVHHGSGTATQVVALTGEGTFSDVPTWIKIQSQSANPGARIKDVLLKRTGDVWYVQYLKYGSGTVTWEAGVDTATVVFGENYSTVKVSKIQGYINGTYKPDGLAFTSNTDYDITVANYELEV